MSRIAVVAFIFPPISCIGYKRPLRLVNYLQQKDCKITVYCGHHRTPELKNYYPTDLSSANQIASGIKIIRTPSFHGFKILIALRNMIFKRNKSQQLDISEKIKPPTPHSFNEKTKRSPLTDFIDKFMELFEIPDQFTGWFFTMTPLMLLDCLFRRPKAIYVTAPPWTPIIVAQTVGSLLKIPVIIDYRDPWTLNTYWKSKKISRRVEKIILKRCTHIIANTTLLKTAFIESFPFTSHKITAIYNGFEDDTKNKINLQQKKTAGKFKNITISHIGKLYADRMPKALAELLADTVYKWNSQSLDLTFRFVGEVLQPEILLNAFKSKNVEHNLELVGNVNYSEALAEEVKCDILFLLQMNTMLQIPAKIFEYVFTGNPILCVADRGSETAQLIENYDIGKVFYIDSTTTDFLKYIMEYSKNRNMRKNAPSKFLADFNGEKLSADIAEILC